MISDYEMILRLLLGALLGILVGFERERQGQPAGLRTHTIMVIGSTLAMTISINIAMQFRPFVPNGDPARLAAQVVSGIGFLGAGAILHYGASVKGLTTATSLWTMAMVGLAVGAGHYVAAVATTVLLLTILTVLNRLEKTLITPYTFVTISVTAGYRDDLVVDLKEVARKHNCRVSSMSVQRDLTRDRMVLDMVVKVRENADLPVQLSQVLAQVPGVENFRIG